MHSACVFGRQNLQHTPSTGTPQAPSPRGRFSYQSGGILIIDKRFAGKDKGPSEEASLHLPLATGTGVSVEGTGRREALRRLPPRTNRGGTRGVGCSRSPWKWSRRQRATIMVVFVADANLLFSRDFPFEVDEIGRRMEGWGRVGAVDSLRSVAHSVD